MPTPFRLVAASLLLALAAPLESAPPEPKRSTVDDQDAMSLRGLFDFQLPKLIRPESLRLTLNPQFGDFAHKSYVRFRTGLRYAFTEHFEVSAEVVPYFDNFGGDGEKGPGLAEYRFGTKFAWHSLLDPYVDTALGATVSMPAPGAPDQLTIGTSRFTPYVVFSRDLKSVRGLSAFLNLGYEIFDSDPAPGRVPRYRPRHDNLIVTPGLVIHRAPWHYTLAASVRTTAFDDESREYFSVFPSVSYEVPERWLPFVSGRVVVGAGCEVIFFDGDIDQRLISRLRWDFDWGRAARNLGTSVREAMPWRNDRGAER